MDTDSYAISSDRWTAHGLLEEDNQVCPNEEGVGEPCPSGHLFSKSEQMFPSHLPILLILAQLEGQKEGGDECHCMDLGSHNFQLPRAHMAFVGKPACSLGAKPRLAPGEDGMLRPPKAGVLYVTPNTYLGQRLTPDPIGSDLLLGCQGDLCIRGSVGRQRSQASGPWLQPACAPSKTKLCRAGQRKLAKQEMSTTETTFPPLSAFPSCFLSSQMH